MLPVSHGGRLSGPEQVRAKLVEVWQLTDNEAAVIFRDDRALCVAFIIHGDLDALFQDFEAEHRWMREPKAQFNGRTPIESMAQGFESDVATLAAYLSGRR